MDDAIKFANLRIQQIYQQLSLDNYRKTDQLFGYLMIAQWLFAMGCALTLSPSTWSGNVSSIHPHVWAALLLGGLLTILPHSFIALRPGEAISRHVIAASQIAMSALLIHLTGGRTETHFHVFGSLAFLAIYRDWKVLITASVLATLDHLVRGVYWPSSVFGTDQIEYWRWTEHAAWVVFEISFLIPACLKAQKEMWTISEKQVQLEMTNERIEKVVEARTAELESAQKQLIQSQKLEAIGQLASGVAHDFNNMLGGIIAYASMLKDDYRGDEQIQSGLTVIENSAERGAELTRKLLAFARKGNYEHKVVNLYKTVEETVSLIQPTLKEKIEIKVEMAEGLWPTEGDSTQVFQVIMNLVVNAKDAMEGSGKIKIGATNIEADDTYCFAHKSVVPGRYVRLTIEDNGSGISADIIEKVFEPFFTTKEVGTGTGLGLSMVYGIMQNHHGAVAVYSEVGLGTVFHLYFPRSSNLEKGRSEVTKISVAPDKFLKGQKVLLADDDSVMRLAGMAILKRYGAEVYAYEDGQLALEALLKSPNDFKLVVLDVIMPNLNGVETFFKMKERAPHLQYVLCSGYAESSEITELRNLYGVKFIQKPYKADQLAQEILKKAA